MKKHLLITSSIIPTCRNILHIDSLERYNETMAMLRDNSLIFITSFDNVYLVDNSGYQFSPDDIRFFRNNNIKLISYLEKATHTNTGFLEARIYAHFISEEEKNFDQDDLIMKISGRYNPKNFKKYVDLNNGFVINCYPNIANQNKGVLASIFSLRVSEFKEFTVQLNKRSFLEPLEIKLQRYVEKFMGKSFFIIYPMFMGKSGSTGKQLNSFKREKLRCLLSYFFRFGIKLR